MTNRSLAAFAACVLSPFAFGQPTGLWPVGGPCGQPDESCDAGCDIRMSPTPRGVWHDDRWPGGIVPYDFGADATATNQAQARAAMDVIESWANVTFVPRTTETSFVHIIPATGNYSSVGQRGGSQELGLYNWGTQAIVIHELMHALGVWHEQSRGDRNTYVEVNYPSIQAGREHNFNSYATEPRSGPYDFESVMHYGPTGFSINGDRTIKVRPPYARAFQYAIGQRTGLSNGDIWTLVEMYGGSPPARNFSLTSPADGAMVGTAWAPTFAWAASDQATQYTLKVDDDPLFRTPEINVTLTATTYSRTTALAARRLYYWTVTATNARGTGKPFPVTTHEFYTDSAVPAIVYVDLSAPTGGDGRSWTSAFRDAQDGLGLAEAFGGSVDEVRIARGTYKPDRGTADRAASFWLADGVTVRGGYAGRSSGSPDANDPTLYPTILTGDLSGNDGGGFSNMGDNSYNVVTGSFTDSTAVLENVTVRGGNASSGTFPRSRGGAVQIDNGSPTIRGCIIENSQSTNLFGGIALSYGGVARFESSQLRAMRTTGNDPSGLGGLVGVRHKSNPVFTDCEFVGGSARTGAAAYVFDAWASFRNCVFRQNNATVTGGALHLDADGDATLLNVSTFGNNAPAGSGMLRAEAGATAVIANSILWGDSPAAVSADATAVVTASYTIAQGGLAGAGNLGTNPLYAAASSGDLSLQAGSPGIDSGDNGPVIEAGLLTDIAGQPRRSDDPGTADGGLGAAPIVDRGAYERQPPCPADVNGDGAVDGSDVETFFLAWEASDPAGDFNLDGGVDGADVESFFLRWEGGC